MYEAETSVIVKLPKQSKRAMERVGRELVRIITERTQSGRDKDGKAFKPYSAEYKESKEFESAGKGSTVNLTLFGEMLTDLQVVQSAEGFVQIGFKDEEQRAKAHGHQTGADGTGRLPVRAFIGATMAELELALIRAGATDDKVRDRILKEGQIL